MRRLICSTTTSTNVQRLLHSKNSCAKKILLKNLDIVFLHCNKNGIFLLSKRIKNCIEMFFFCTGSDLSGAFCV